MINVLEIVNLMKPGTVTRFALTDEDWEGDAEPVAFMGGFVELAPGASLPSEADVTAYEATYDATVLKAQANALIKAQIDALELTITDRRRDEAILGTDNGWLKNIRDQITALRSQLTK